MSEFVATTDQDVERLTTAITTGDVGALERCLAERPELATAYFGGPDIARTSLHVATDWPGHFPRVADVIAALVAAGADVDAPFIGTHTERPLHWAASSGDLAALDALIAAGADLEAPGGVLTGGPPLDDAVIFDMLDAARRLVASGASTRLFHAAALGSTHRVGELLAVEPPQGERDAALWHACRHGARDAAVLLLAAGADPDFEGFADTTTRQAAAQTGDEALVALLERRP